MATTYNSFADNRFLPKNFGDEIESLKKLCEIITLKNKFNGVGSVCISFITPIAPEVDSFLAIWNNLNIWRNYENYKIINIIIFCFRNDN